MLLINVFVICPDDARRRITPAPQGIYRSFLLQLINVEMKLLVM